MARAASLDRLTFRDNRCPLDTRINIEQLLALPYRNVTQVNQTFELRPALLSAFAYGTPDYWWVLLDYNQLTFSQFVVGTVIRLPEIGPLREVLRTSNLRMLSQQANTATDQFRLPRRTLIV